VIRIVGLGLSIDFVPLGGVLRLLTCSKVFLDIYTSYWYPSIELLAEILERRGMEVKKAGRYDLEGDSIKNIVEEAKHSDICIAVAGDPLIATTHSAIVVEALRRGINVEVFPASSILNVAVTLSCLQAYRFGKMVTIVKPKNGIVYEYPLHVVKSNRDRDLHTLALLEIDLELNYFMTPREALEILFNIQRSYGYNVVDYDDKIIILKALGSEDSSVEVESAREILGKNYPPALYTLIIPAKSLHPIEKECIENINKIKLKPLTSIELLKEIIDTVTSYSMKRKLFNV
jgi:diphthine synthase